MVEGEGGRVSERHTRMTGSFGQETELGVSGVGWSRTLHLSHEQGTLIVSHCGVDNTLFMPGLQPTGIISDRSCKTLCFHCKANPMLIPQITRIG